MAPNLRPPQQSYLKQVVPPEAIIINNSWRSKIKETKKTKKSQAVIVAGVDNHQQSKP